MKGKKLFLAKILYYSGLIRLGKYGSSNLIVFNYHRIKKCNDTSNYDEDVFGPTVSEFTKQIKWLKSNTEVISVKSLIEILDGKKSPPKLSTIITFDDGYVDNYTLAYPVLKENSIPAIFFVPSMQITNRELGWWDIISYIIKKTKNKSIVYKKEVVQLDDKKNAIRYFQKIMKTKNYNETEDLISILSEVCNVQLPTIDAQSNELMTWDQVREVSKNGIDIGSHTHSHRVLSTLSIDEQKKELFTSKKIIENEIDKKINAIAYPVGNYQHFTNETMDMVSECGYEIGFSFNTGINNFKKIYNSNIKRIEPSVSVEMLASTAYLPKIFV